MRSLHSLRLSYLVGSLTLPLASGGLACGGSVSDSSAPREAPDAGPVHGHIVFEDGTPAGYGRVMLGQHVVDVGQDGTFTFDAAPATYDLAFDAGGVIEVLQGMTTRTPMLRSAGRTYDPESAEVDMRLPFPLASHGVLMQGPAGLEIVTGAPAGAAGATDTNLLHVTLNWLTPPTEPSTVRVLSYVQDPTTYGLKEWTGTQTLGGLLPGAGTTTWNVELTPVETAVVSMHADLPEGYSPFQAHARIHGEPDSGLSFMNDEIQFPVRDQTFPLLLPRIDGLTFDVAMEAASDSGSVLSSAFAVQAQAGTATIATPESAPELVSPEDNAAGVTAATRFVVGGAGVVKHLRFYGKTQSLTVVTSATTFVLPDLSPLGHVLPASDTVQWFIERCQGEATVEDAAAVGLNMPMRSRAWYARSMTRTFTTAP
jgi:hypothetical protein